MYSFFEYIRIMPLFPDGARSPLARAVSAEIRSLMAARRVTGRTLAQAIGLKSHNYLAIRLRDEKAFTLDDIELIAAYFSKDPAELIADAERNHGERLWAESVIAIEDPIDAAKYAALRESQLGFWWDDFEDNTQQVARPKFGAGRRRDEMTELVDEAAWDEGDE